MSTLHAACFEPHWSEAEIGRLVAAPRTLAAVASCPLNDGAGMRPAGMAICRSAGAEAEILTLGVIPGCRRAGVAACLVSECRLMAADAGAAHLLLEVAADNTAALALYTGRGFRQVGRWENYYGPQNKRSTSKDALILRLDFT
ncbi:MAG: GNAT family N-acetyltransferase [Proteobacteria bacterium]|nr:GNAT family N-acetyltransferase [Pseudomonadota bacterium]